MTYKLPRFVTEYANYQITQIQRMHTPYDLKLMRRITDIHFAATMGEITPNEAMYELSKTTTPDYIESISNHD